MNKQENNGNTVNFVLTQEGIHKIEQGIKAIQDYIASQAATKKDEETIKPDISYETYTNQVVFHGIPADKAPKVAEKTRTMLSKLFGGKPNLTYGPNYDVSPEAMMLGSSKISSPDEGRIHISINNPALQFNNEAIAKIEAIVEKHVSNKVTIQRTPEGVAISNIPGGKADTLRNEFQQFMAPGTDINTLNRDDKLEGYKEDFELKIAPKYGYEIGQRERKIITGMCKIHELEESGKGRGSVTYNKQKTEGILVSGTLTEKTLSDVKREFRQRLGENFEVEDTRPVRALSAPADHNLPHYT